MPERFVSDKVSITQRIMIMKFPKKHGNAHARDINHHRQHHSVAKNKYIFSSLHVHVYRPTCMEGSSP